MASQVFKPSFGNKPDKIVGRDQVIEDFINGLRAPIGSRERTMLYVGQRGMGKTALLLEFNERARSEGFVVARVTAGSSMLEEIIELVQLNGSEFVPRKTPKVKGASIGAMGFSVGLTFSDEVRENYGFRVKLGLLCKRLEGAGKGVLILVDEVQAASDELRTLATTYQNLVGDGLNVAVGMAGLPTSVNRLLNDKVLTFLNRARKVELEAISVSSVRAYYGRVFSQMGKTWEDGVLDAAARGSRGFPYLMQLLGYYLVEIAGNDSTISSATLNEALGSSRADLVDTVYAPVLAGLSERDMRLLMAMSEDEGVSKVADLKRRLGENDSQFQPYRARLIAAKVIDSPRHGELEFTVPYLGEYLRTLA